MSDRAFRVVLRMQTRPGAGRAFEATWGEVARTIATDPANLGQWMLRDVTDPDVYYVISDWVDERSFREFEHSAAHLENRRRLGEHRIAGWMGTMTPVTTG